MSVCKCWDCGYEQVAPTVEEARRLARLHMGLTPHLMCFGYTDAEYKERIEDVCRTGLVEETWTCSCGNVLPKNQRNCACENER